MRVLYCKEPGKFEFGELKNPKLSKGSAIIQIKKIGVCGTDLHAFEGTQPFFEYPRILGHELSGIISEINEDSEFALGDEVTIMPYFYCGECIACQTGKTNCCANISVFGVHEDGGMQEFISISEKYILKAKGLSLEELALTEPLAIAVHGVRRGQVAPGETVVVMGAGPIGLGIIAFAIQAGAKVIVMDINEDRLRFAEEHFDVHATVNAAGNFEKVLADITNGDMAEVVIDATGSHIAIHNGFKIMAHGGRYVLVGLQKGDIVISHPDFHKRESTLMSSRNATKSDFEFVIQSLQNKSINARAFITHHLNFAETANQFPALLKPQNKVIKAVISF